MESVCLEVGGISIPRPFAQCKEEEQERLLQWGNSVYMSNLLETTGFIGVPEVNMAAATRQIDPLCNGKEQLLPQGLWQHPTNLCSELPMAGLVGTKASDQVVPP
jgi:hypothetical protein